MDREKKMEITTNIEKQAKKLGELLRESDAVQNYLNTQKQFEEDQIAQALQQQFTQTYERLTQKQDFEGELTDKEIQEFNQLRFQLQTHPLITERDAALAEVRSLFTHLSTLIQVTLGLDFANMAVRFENAQKANE